MYNILPIHVIILDQISPQCESTSLFLQVELWLTAAMMLLIILDQLLLDC